MAKHRAKVEKRQLQEAIDSGMIKAKGLGKKMRKDKQQGARPACCGRWLARLAAWLVKCGPACIAGLQPRAAAAAASS